MKESKFHVGQTVLVGDVNRNGRPPREAKVVKVGRTLVHVEGEWSGIETYRIDTGQRNNNYGHQWIRTEAECADDMARIDVRRRLRAVGISLEFGASHHSTAVLEQVAALLEAPALPPAPNPERAA